MPLTLTLENESNLPDGGPLSVTVRGQRGLYIGRDAHLDWTLPDPSRFISGKHCEVRWHDGGYWLHDVSTNGTFLNGADRRMTEPHRLRSGDRLVIGQYLIAVALDGEEAQPPLGRTAKPAANQEELWDSGSAAPPPIDKRDLRPPPQRGEVSDFLDWAVDLPAPTAPTPPPRAAKAMPDLSGDDFAWAPPKAAPPPPEPPPAVPSPRRPVWNDDAATPADAPPATSPNVSAPAPVLESAPAIVAAPARVIESSARAAQVLAASTVPPEVFAPSMPRAMPLSVQGNEGDAFVNVFARAAGLPEGALGKISSDGLAQTLGALMRDVTGDLMMLLQARADARRVARTSSQTMIQALDNNPLKFSPTPEDAMRIMFGPPTRNYLDAQKAFHESFANVKQHQLITFTAMQRALQQLVEDLSPEAIEKRQEGSRGLGSVMTSPKARAWDNYKIRWEEKTHRQDDGMLGAFMLLFSKAYEEAEQE